MAAVVGPVTVGTTSTTLLASGSRKKVTFVNNGSYRAYLMYTPAGSGSVAAVVGKGIRLNPSGGVYTTDSQGSWTAISIYGGTTITGEVQ